MTARPPRVAVVGAGLGGLCLAHGLSRRDSSHHDLSHPDLSHPDLSHPDLSHHDIAATVYERDLTASIRRQGYRLHVDSRAALALEQCLPPDLFALFLATCGRPGRRFTVLSKRLRELHRIEGDRVTGTQPETAATLSTSVNRQTLREILLTDLDVRFGHELTRYVTEPDRITLHFADGTSAETDILVGADGVNSAVRRQLLPGAEVIETATRCIYGKTYLDQTTLSLVPAPLHDGFTAIVARGVGVAAGLVRFREPPPEAAARLAPAARLSPARDYLMWAVTAEHPRFRTDLTGLDATGLHQVAMRMLRSWHKDLRSLVARADVAETFLVPIRTSVPIDAWPPSRVTVLGDAIHAMSPARGSGANIALTDAALLARTLAKALDGEPHLSDPIVAAIGVYEAAMRDYGFAAVRASGEVRHPKGRF